MIRPAALLLAALTAALLPAAVPAQDYPNKPVRFVVPYPAGGGSDIAGRMVAMRLGEALGQQVVIDNRPGAGSTIGADIAAKAQPDGYTLLFCNNALAINATLYPKLPYDTLRDLAPITLIATNPSLLVVNPGLPAKSVKDLIALAKAQPGRLNFASSGVGTGPHLGGALFASLAGIQMTHVPYRGAAPAIADVIGGQVQLMFATMVASLPQVQSGRLRSLAVTSAKRSSQLPDVPTVAEAALPGYEYVTWYMLLAPAKTPAAIVGRLSRDMAKVAGNAEVRERFAKEGADIVGSSGAEAAAYLKTDIARWAKVIRETGVKPEG